MDTQALTVHLMNVRVATALKPALAYEAQARCIVLAQELLIEIHSSSAHEMPAHYMPSARAGIPQPGGQLGFPPAEPAGT